MSLSDTKANVQQDLTPQSVDHWVRLSFAGVLTATGVFVIVYQCVQTGSPGWLGPVVAFGGVGVAFTKTVVALSKAILPFKITRSG